MLRLSLFLLGTFNFKVEDHYEDEIYLVQLVEVFSRFLKNRRAGKLHCTFFTRKVSAVIFIEEGKPPRYRDVIKPLTLHSFFPSLRHFR